MERVEPEVQTFSKDAEVLMKKFVNTAVEEALLAPRLVTGVASGKVHLVASSTASTPSSCWKTCCGWAFARSSFMYVKTCPPGRACDRCPVLLA